MRSYLAILVGLFHDFSRTSSSNVPYQREMQEERNRVFGVPKAAEVFFSLNRHYSYD